jgi:hypothetical protein
MDQVNFFCTTDLKTATYLYYKGFSFTVEKEEGMPTVFIFDQNAKLLESLVRQFRNGSAELRLLNCFKELKIIAINGEYKKYNNKTNGKGSKI